MSQIPYTLIGGQKFYDKKEVKDLIAYLSVLVNPMDQIALRRILNIPNRGIGRATLEKYLTLSEEKEVSLFRAMEQTPDLDPKRADHINNFVRLIRSFQDKFEKDPLPQALNALIEDLKYFQFIDKHQDNPKQAERRKKDVMFFVESAERFQNFYQGKSVLKKFIEKLMLQDSSDTEDDDEEDTDVRKNQVTLMTLHSSKGLEFRKVFLVGMEEELLPHKRTISLGEDISEERRLCYVGITRAQEELIMTYCKERMIYGKKMPRHKSRFLIGDEGKTLCEEYDRTTFGHLSEDEAQEYKKSFFSNLFDSLD
jgi:superfamily I DNA/RNA helicase